MPIVKAPTDLYLDNGYLNFDAVEKIPADYVLICGGRGTGKTFGALKKMVEDKKVFALMRRTQLQVDALSTPSLSPFKSVNEFLGSNIEPANIARYIAGFFNTQKTENGEFKPVGKPIGLLLALSTIKNLRGFDASDVEVLIYDEFIPEKHERKIKNEFDAFCNAYETINRNRELEGRPPLRCYCLANSNEIGNPLFLGLELVRVADKLTKTEGKMYLDKNRSLCLLMLNDSRISEAKAETALYKLTRGTSFENMSLNNDFNESDTFIKNQNLNEYKPLVAVGEICIYIHRNGGKFYVTGHFSGKPQRYASGELDLKAFKKAYGYLWLAYYDGYILFEDILSRVLFEHYFDV